jgi:arginase family enzyme
VEKISVKDGDLRIHVPSVKIAYEESDVVTGKTKLKDLLPQKTQQKSAVCIDLTAIRSGFTPGVSEPNAVMGLTEDDLKELVETLSKTEHDDLVIISEYNPAIEKMKTGQIVVKIF